MLGIRKLDIFITKQFALLFVGTFFICQFVLMMQFLWRYVDELIGKGLSMDVMAQFFWYMGLMLVPQALPLALLLSSLITFGNLGESSELTAIKAAGISLMEAMRPLIVIALIVAGCSYYFQDVVGPKANKQFRQLLLSMKQKSPELEIPEGIFYDGIPGSNIYVERKEVGTGMLYGVMIYRMSGGYEDAAIILADSGMMQSTAEKKHLLLTLWSGEWFENMKSQDIAGSASVPYRRESFGEKRLLLDFDGEFSMTDMSGISSDARSKSMARLRHDLDSIREYNDSVGRAYYREAQRTTFRNGRISRADSLQAKQEAMSDTFSIDTIFKRLTAEEKQAVVKNAMNSIGVASAEVNFKGDYSYYLNRVERMHRIEAITKITLSLSCIIFFFIGAPLGAIIRKGGLGVPVIISVIVFIIYYIFENTGSKMARDGFWTIALGKSISTLVLAPMAAFFTYKANNDSIVFNIDLYKTLLYKALGLRRKRHVAMKEVIITDPDYAADALRLESINALTDYYARRHNLLKAPNPIKVFFREGDDRSIRHLSRELEEVIDDLANTKDRHIMSQLNNYPILATHAHTRPFRRRWLNALTGILLPIGLFFYLRMWRFRLRLHKDLKTIRHTNDNIIRRIEQIVNR